MTSYIKRIFIKDIGPFRDTIIEFNNKFNVIAGSNGTGKSLISKLISNCFTTKHLKNIRSNSNDGEFWIEIAEKQKFYGIGIPRGYDKKLYKYMKTSNYVKVKKPTDFNANKLEAFLFPDMLDNQTNINKLEDARYIKNKRINLAFSPLFMGPFRYIEYKHIDGPKKDVDVISSRINYRKFGYDYLSTSKLPNVKQWIVTRFNNKKAGYSWAKIQSSNFDYIFGKLNEIVPPNNKLELLEIDQDYEIKLKFNDQIVYLEELSGGYQAVFSLIFNIVNWLEVINEDNGQHVENAEGTVIIDEIDAHLHPNWQLNIVQILKKLFPNLQFILTTHSPHILSSCEKNEIIMLSNRLYDSNERDRIVIKPLSKSYSGWDYVNLLEQLMGVDNLSSRPYEKIDLN